MPNALNNAALTVAAQAALAALYHEIQTLPTIARDYGGALDRGKGDTARVRNEVKIAAANYAGSANGQDLTETFVDVKIDQQPNSQITLTHKEMTFGIEDYAMQVVRPQLRGIAEFVDTYVLARLVAAAPTAALGAALTSALDVITTGRKALNDQKVPFGDRYLVLTAADAQKLLKIPGLIAADATGDGGQAWREGYLGRKFGVTIYESQFATTSTMYHSSAAAFAGARPADPLGGVTSGTAEFDGIVAQVLAGYDNGSLSNKGTAQILFGCKENLDGLSAGNGKRAIKLSFAGVTGI